MRGIVGSVKAAFSKDLVYTGLGAFGTGVATRLILAKFGPVAGAKDSAGNTTYTSTLPGATTKTGLTLYGVGIPIALGIFARRFSPALSNGAYLYGISTLINTYLAPTVNAEIAKLSGTAAYIGGGRRLAGVPGVGRIPGPRTHTAVDQFSNFPGQRQLFATNAWNKQ